MDGKNFRLQGRTASSTQICVSPKEWNCTKTHSSENEKKIHELLSSFKVILPPIFAHSQILPHFFFEEDIKLEHQLGEGSFGSVWRGNVHGTPAAIKVDLILTC